MRGDFPVVESYARPTTCHLIEYAEDRKTERSNIQEVTVPGSIERVHEHITARAAN